MSMTPVSVIIPSYNYAEYVGCALESCLEQHYPNLEVIVVDDASTDNTRQYFKNPSLSEIREIRYVRLGRNVGYSAAKNVGIRASTGKYIVTLDADDMLTPDSLHRRADHLDAHPEVDMVCGKAFIVGIDGGYEYYCRRMYKLAIHAGKKIHAQTTMLRRELHQKYGLYDEDLRSRSDNEMWNRLINVGHINIARIPEPPLAFYRRHPLSMIAYRKKNPAYNAEVTARLLAAKEMRLREGINPQNTPMLES